MLLYSRYYLVLTLLSMIALALPSDDGASVTTRKLAKGSKKNPSMLFQEEIPVPVMAQQKEYPYVQLKNQTPYPVAPREESGGWFSSW